MSQQQMPEMRNLIIAVVLSTVVLLGWQIVVEQPKAEKMAVITQQKKTEEAKLAAIEAAKMKVDGGAPQEMLPRVEQLTAQPRVPIATSAITGSVNLQGLRIDDVTFAHYNETIKKDSAHVTLLNPASDNESYFGEFGWLSGSKDVAVPTSDTLWQTTQTSLESIAPLVATWNNNAGLEFEQRIAAKDDYLFEVTQMVTNSSARAVTLYPYGLVSRRFVDQGKHFLILHEGPLGVFDDVLTEVKYKDLREEPKQSFNSAKGWLGITDKYWLTALIPDQKEPFKANMTYGDNKGDRYQVDYMGAAIKVEPGQTISLTHHFFVGAKKVGMLDQYAKKYEIPLFDRAVDFGVLYFLTKPIFNGLQMLYHALGNFGLAIMALTVIIKLMLFPLANKSYKSMSQMKVLMPKITEIRERYKDDNMKMNQEIMALYKREKVNPASGCLPMLLQLPVFFALYKVLFVTIEMRHAPFYGWIHDLSAADPTTIFNLFGLISYDPPKMLMIGAWPIIMCVTMVIQQRLNPKPTDPTQAMIMSWLPFIFLFLFASFPAGLVIYWAWNNTLSIIQQWVISRRHAPKDMAVSQGS